MELLCLLLDLLKSVCDVGQASAYAGAHRLSKRQQKPSTKPDGACTSLGNASGQKLKGKGKLHRKQPPKSQLKARAAPKQRPKTGIVESLAATDAEIKQGFFMLLPSRDGKLTADSLQKVWQSLLHECCNESTRLFNTVFLRILLPCTSDWPQLCIAVSHRLLNAQSMGTKSELRQSPELTDAHWQLAVGLKLQITRPAKPMAICAKLCPLGQGSPG